MTAEPEDEIAALVTWQLSQRSKQDSVTRYCRHHGSFVNQLKCPECETT